MKPSDVPQRDWPLYYEGTFMNHVVHGPVNVTLQGPGGTFLIKRRRGGGWAAAEPGDLEVWWPRSGAYNTGGTAVYIGRRARRSMKKSASGDHYYVQWGELARGNVMFTIIEGENFLPIPTAVEVLSRGAMQAAAVSRDIILAPMTQDRNRLKLIYKGVEAGVLENGEFFAYNEGTPAAKRARVKLQQLLHTRVRTFEDTIIK